MIYFCESSNYILAHENHIYIFMSVFTYIIFFFFFLSNIYTQSIPLKLKEQQFYKFAKQQSVHCLSM